MKQQMHETVDIPEGCTATYQDRMLTVKGEAGEVSRQIWHPKITIAVKDSEITMDIPVATQREKRHIYTLRSHIRNMMKGASEGHTYKLKVCSGHFPMNVAVSGDALTVKNFLGEAVPRVCKIKDNVKVKLDGDIIEVTSADKEMAGSQASDIEQLTRITNRDRRIFQDGLFIIEKDGVPL